MFQQLKVLLVLVQVATLLGGIHFRFTLHLYLSVLFGIILTEAGTLRYMSTILTAYDYAIFSIKVK